MDKNTHSQHNPAQNNTPNQHHAIQYSSRFTSETSKPVPLAHFMGARRDLKGPVLTKQRVDEKEIRPDGWELAEKRFQQAQASGGAGGLNSLASLLSGGSSGSNLSSHAGNFTKRALPGMVPQDRINSQDTKQANNNNNNNQQRDTKPSFSSKFDHDKPKTFSNPSSQSTSIPTTTTSHAASFLKPKSLADRLAQLGVTNEIKTNIPPSHPAASSPRADKFPSTDQINNQQPEPESIQADPPRNFNRITKSNSAIFNTAPQQTLPEEKSDRKEQRPLSVHIAPPRDPNPRTKASPILSSPQTNTPREPLSTRPNGPSQPTSGPSYKRNNRPQSAFPHAPHISTEGPTTLGVPNKALTASLSRLAGSNIVAQRLEWSKQKEQLGTMDEFGSPLIKTSPNSTYSAHNSQIPSPVLPPQPITQNPVFSERSKNAIETPAEEPSGGLSQARPHSVQRQNTGPKHTESAQYDFPLTHVSQESCSSPSASLRLVSAKARAEAAKVCSPPLGGTIASRQLPSIPSFSPLMKKGTSELAAVWGSQLSNPTKKAIDGDPLPKKSPHPLTSPLNAHRPLPTPPSATLPPARPRTATAPDSRPLPVPPAAVSATTPLSPEPRARTRPLPTPQFKSESSSLSKALKDKEANVYPQSQIDVSKIWASYEEKQESLSALAQADKLVQLEIFQLNRTQTDELSTTMLDREDYGTFYSEESLLIICTMKGSKMVLMVWRGREVREEDGGTEGRIGRLLKKYGIDRQASLVIVNQGYEPPELVQALGGRLLLRTGDRFDSVYQRGLSAVFTCKSFPLPSSSFHDPNSQQDERVVIIEEHFLNHPTSDPAITLCTGYPSLIKICLQQQPSKLGLYLWNGRLSNPLELEECKLLAHQVRNEAGAYKTELEVVEEGNESDRFLSLLGDVNFARSYHWRYKELVPMRTMIVDAHGQQIDRVSLSDISILWTGLEVFILVPPSITNPITSSSSSSSMTMSMSMSMVEKQVRNALGLARSLATSSSSIAHSLDRFHQLPKRILATHCLLFPSIIPVDLLASVRFGNHLDRLNEGFPRPNCMNLISLDEFCSDPTSSLTSSLSALSLSQI
ncbi:uncharacterized protein PGTG_13123 [Puccinia graminis f. sp. tritici CRL 75-36-700-3]|uniref:Gelsolin-like domain-containing protein n=1 Tax=Puccinia graminis f. sp. tritici (strain CRL 75-36-700-3 / race SCCL) TaxID=418459 RepID=E3KR16_PUCGT|nr:uncharacterized protein PGTG_13123 [Puccinia graminis f. sp. tritici CRL 75-36-700-3]EFP86741.1 hypothetical protein PGTG_13123 [Puccinia graminis f. sp. tritici CRL 75-36-700-3]